MDRLTADDLVILMADGRWPQDVGLVGVLDGARLIDAEGRFRLESVRAMIGTRLEVVPRLRQRLEFPRRGLGPPVWVEDRRFDLDDHLRVARIPEPGSEAQFLAVVEELRRHRLVPSRPLWEMWFLLGMPRARVGLFIRVHHVFGDGLAGLSTLTRLLQSDGGGLNRARAAPAAPPTDRALLADNVRRQIRAVRRTSRTVVHPVGSMRALRANVPALRDLLAYDPWPDIGFNRLVGSHRALAVVRSRFDLVQNAAHLHHATVNDVLLAAMAGGMRELLEKRRVGIDDLELPIYVPISLRQDEDDPPAGNKISETVISLPIGIGDHATRLERIAAETTRRKAMTRPPLGSVFHGRLLSGIMMQLIARKRVNLTSSDLIGPAAPLSVAGAPLLEIYPLMNLIGNVTLGVAAISYAGQFNLMVIADAETFPDLGVFVAGMRRELDALTDPTSRSAEATA
ncbi:MAG TPA: wax ester/triacylglycerol synthase domain-containing protein [Mycobacterium sp.]